MSTPTARLPFFLPSSMPSRCVWFVPRSRVAFTYFCVTPPPKGFSSFVTQWQLVTSVRIPGTRSCCLTCRPTWLFPFSWLIRMLTPLEPQSRFGDKPVKFEVVCPQNGTAVLKGLRLCAQTSPLFTRTRYSLSSQPQTCVLRMGPAE